MVLLLPNVVGDEGEVGDDDDDDDDRRSKYAIASSMARSNGEFNFRLLLVVSFKEKGRENKILYNIQNTIDNPME